MNLVKANKESITKASQIIKTGGLVAFPTETVYGLGADALNPLAVAKIFEVKKRPSFNPLIIHIAEKDWLNEFTIYNDERINLIINKFWPGPLTLVLEKKNSVPNIVTSGNPTVAVRMPNHPVALELIKQSETPIAAPSANKFGHLSPTTAKHVHKYLGEKVDLILDGGKSDVGVESTIVHYDNGNFYLLRFGGVTKEELEEVIGEIKLKPHNAKNPNSPGQLPFHYSPNTPLYFFDEKLLSPKKKIGVIFFQNKKVDFEFNIEKFLSLSGDLREAASNLFLFLHELEKENLDYILIEPVEEKGLGKAIMDRLRKATFKHTIPNH
ncbi:MAG: L-threonylcarbamoyladenylate synthase [Melioribacteraceae bacterium]|nr:L-threonylcarbamoyladenylate synthase [Melioribacteraceae bacterium]